jgi:hypothetical protein
MPAEGRIAAIFEHEKRGAGWAMPRRLRVIAVCGQVDLDLCRATVEPGVSEIDLSLWLSQLELHVPWWMRVEADDGVELTWARGVRRPEETGAPVRELLRITGSTFGAEITVRPAPLPRALPADA